ncbi:MAG: hydroxymethylglutaryl-CoA lyase [Candidatus Eremiobacteraeota bacterium]|nr:hydroxymethylglutaryl-CoA lyase [Candidatus Eremiobacteraeota bacterium]
MKSQLGPLPARVTICEVGPRDGLQNESQLVSADDKVHYIDLLSESGLSLIETTSFVSPKAVPQIGDAAEVMARIRRRPGVRYLVLVPNVRGLERAQQAGADAVAVFTAATESFAKRNINMTIAQSLETFGEVVASAKRAGMWVRGYISTAFGCPYEGTTPVASVIRVARALVAMGCDEISVGDTIGVATPLQVADVVARLRDEVPLERLALHLHDTRGTALANIVAGLQQGVAIFDSSSGGLGGCPFAPGATGNVATEDVLYLLDGMGIETRVDLAKVRAASRFIAGVLRRDQLPSRAFNALEAAAAR